MDVRLNLPGHENYDPWLPWVSKIRKEDGHVASDFWTYIDDLRNTGPTEKECWASSRRIATICSYLGIQDAARKRRAPSQKPGPWAGTVTHTLWDRIGIKVEDDKWNKTWSHVQWLVENHDDPNGLDRKILESVRGFLVYVGRTYPALVPYLKGLHNTLDGWRPGRDKEGWRMTRAELQAACADPQLGGSDGKEELKGAPARVKAVLHLAQDVCALAELVGIEAPPLRAVHPKAVKTALYGFVDAAGSGFGSSLDKLREAAEKSGSKVERLKGVGLKVRYGLWGKDMDGSSSNFRELRNLVETVEAGVLDRSLRDVELFIFTDNSVSEHAFANGNSSSPLLFQLVLRLRKAEMHGGLKLHVIHVAGTRMMEQGTDGLSRGSLLEGVMSGESMLEFVPLGDSALDRAVGLKEWLDSWWGGGLAAHLMPKDWFRRGHGVVGGERNEDGIWFPKLDLHGPCVWSPPPAAATVAVEELRKARHKRPSLPQLFVCPRLMTRNWLRQLMKVTDVVFTVPPGAPFWPSHMHEPSIVGICLPPHPRHPWRAHVCQRMLGVGWKLRGVWKRDAGVVSSILRKFFLRPWALEFL